MMARSRDPKGTIPAARIIEAGGLPGVEISRQRGQFPLRHGGQCMVEASLTDATCRQESQVDSERANKRFRVGWPPAADLAQKGRSYRRGGVLAGVSTERRKHLLHQVLMAINGYLATIPDAARAICGRRSERTESSGTCVCGSDRMTPC